MHNEMNTQMNNMNNSGMMSFITKNGFDKESFKKTMHTPVISGQPADLHPDT